MGEESEQGDDNEENGHDDEENGDGDDKHGSASDSEGCDGWRWKLLEENAELKRNGESQERENEKMVEEMVEEKVGKNRRVWMDELRELDRRLTGAVDVECDERMEAIVAVEERVQSTLDIETHERTVGDRNERSERKLSLETLLHNMSTIQAALTTESTERQHSFDSIITPQESTQLLHRGVELMRNLRSTRPPPPPQPLIARPHL
ncbi:hypothetical protein DFH27DRAFT_616900 [Peziza echinospora]|nr:hypothetical protein DFH27DRAFT_616900 [Peziza echinospora]